MIPFGDDEWTAQLRAARQACRRRASPQFLVVLAARRF
jgi:hypothetical protein